MNNGKEDDKRLVIGAHYDTTYWSQGANDNGSGLAAAMVLAQELVSTELPFDLTLALFGAEETGLNGSYAYVAELGPREWERTMAMINLDAIGAGNLSAIGSDEMMGLALQAAGAKGIILSTVGLSDAYSSDHLPFKIVGIPWVFIFADDFSVINSPSDTLEHLQRAPLVHATELALELVEHLAELGLAPDELERIEVEAPVESVEIVIDGGFVELVLVTGLPDGCHEYGRYSIAELETAIPIGVVNLRVAASDIACVAVYETRETRVPLTRAVEACSFYDVAVNGETHRVRAVERGHQCS